MDSVTKDLLEALKWAVREVERNTCHHEETERLGFIWTRCTMCGKKWADDEGGFVPHRDSTELESARVAIARAEAALAEEVRAYVQAVPDHCDRITWRGSYYHLPIPSKATAPQPDADGWIPWVGGECPLPSGTEHFVRLRNGNQYGPDDDPESWRWSHHDDDGVGDDIIAYRVVQEPK